MIGTLAARRIAALALLAAAPSLRAAGDWQVSDAALRYKVNLTTKPTHPTAGYYVHLPDGGILRGTMPSPTVMTEDGKVIPSFLLWQNSESGFSMVFADPGASKAVYIYSRTGPPPQFWKAETGLTPSAILCVSPGHESIPVALNLAKMGRVEPAVHSENKAGIPKAPLSIGGDDTGRPKPASFYLLSYLDVHEAGKYWISPTVRTGADEILIDGAKLVPKERSKKWGGTGAPFDLTQGLHRLEIFQTAPGNGPYDTSMNSGGLMYLTWRAPGDKMKEVETRTIKDSEIVRSGSCALESVEAKDGSPVACAQLNPTLTYWFENEEPLIMYNFQALGSPTADTTYSWTFPEGGTLEGKSVQWLIPGFRESRVKLVAKSAKGVSQCVIPFVGFGTQPTSLDKEPTREAFRTVMAKMLEAYPRNPDPVAGWTDAYWNNLLRTVEEGQGYPVLRQLFTDRWETMRKKLSAAQITPLQDVLLDLVERDNPKDAIKWLEKFYAATPDIARKNELKLRNAETQMFYLGEKKAAGDLLAGLSNLNGDIGERAKVRLGDLAFMEGDLNKATGYYADLQNRARAQRNSAPALPGGLVTNQLLAGGAAATPPSDPKNPPPTTPKNPASGDPSNKGGALQEVSLSENVRTLTEGGYLLEAKQALQTWEREFPLSKISGDFIIRESALYMKSGDFKRAQPMLEAYCREIDASSFLPEAASMLITCVKQLKEPTDSIREIIQKVKGRLLYHPVAKQLDAFLSGK